MKYLILTLLLAVSASAELRQDVYTYVGRSNATASAITPLEGNVTGRGLLYRIEVNVSGTTKTNNLKITDGDGYTILSNAFLSGTTTTWFTNNPTPFIGTVVNGFGASNATITNTIKILYQRFQ